MTIEHVIKAADVVMGPPVMVGAASPILQQAEAIASAAWSRSEVPKAFHTAPAVPDPAIQFFENNMKIVSIISRFTPPRSNPQPELNATDAISEAEAIFRQARRPVIVPLPKPEVNTILGPTPATKTDPATETGLSSRTAHVIHAPVTKEQEVKEVIEKKKELYEEDTDDQTEVKNSKESSLLKMKIVEDAAASQTRRGEIRAALKKLGRIGRIGRLVARLLTIRFWRAKSQIVGDGKDWTIDLTASSIESDTTEYESEEEAERCLVSYVEKHIPVKKGEGGRRATVGEVRKVIRGADKEILPKTSAPAEIVIKRIVEKRVAVENGVELILEDKVDTYSEPNIADLGLSAVFTGLTDQNSLS